MVRAIWQAQQLGIPVDTIPLARLPQARAKARLHRHSGQVFSGERFPIDVTLESPGPAGATRHATIEMTAEGKSIGASQVALVPGPNRLRLQATVNSVGAVALAGENLRRQSRRNALRRRRHAAASPRPAGFARPRRQRAAPAAHARGQPVRSRGIARWHPEKLDDYQLVVVNNWDMGAIPAARKAALEDFVKQGGGLLWIAGERNVYVEKKAKRTPWNARSPPGSRRRARPKAPPWSWSWINRLPWRAARSIWRGWPPSEWSRTCGPSTRWACWSSIIRSSGRCPFARPKTAPISSA